MHKTAAEVMAEMTVEEFTHWLAFYRLRAREEKV